MMNTTNTAEEPRPLFWLDTGRRSGNFNMALDAALAESFLTPHFPLPANAMLVRFYGWKPFCISLGFHQRETDIDLQACETAGIEVVRRPTGGRAVYHADELTYSVILKAIKSNAEHYADIHHALKLGLEKLGVRCEFEQTAPDLQQRYRSAEAVPCFTASAKYELEVGGKKLVGSAQRRFNTERGDVLLQHGSILLSPKHKDLTKFLNASDEVKKRIEADLDRKTVSVSEITGDYPAHESAAAAMVASFGEIYCVQPERIALEELQTMDTQQMQGNPKGLSLRSQR